MVLPLVIYSILLGLTISIGSWMHLKLMDNPVELKTELQIVVVRSESPKQSFSDARLLHIVGKLVSNYG